MSKGDSVWRMVRVGLVGVSLLLAACSSPPRVRLVAGNNLDRHEENREVPIRIWLLKDATEFMSEQTKYHDIFVDSVDKIADENRREALERASVTKRPWALKVRHDQVVTFPEQDTASDTEYCEAFSDDVLFVGIVANFQHLKEQESLTNDEWRAIVSVSKLRNDHEFFLNDRRISVRPSRTAGRRKTGAEVDQ